MWVYLGSRQDRTGQDRRGARQSACQSILTITSGLHAIDTQSRVTLFRLSALDLCQGLNGAEARVLGQSHGYAVESVGKGAHGVLFKTGRLDGGIFDGERAGDFSGATSVDDAVVLDQVADDAESVM